MKHNHIIIIIVIKKRHTETKQKKYSGMKGLHTSFRV